MSMIFKIYLMSVSLGIDIIWWTATNASDFKKRLDWRQFFSQSTSFPGSLLPFQGRGSWKLGCISLSPSLPRSRCDTRQKRLPGRLTFSRIIIDNYLRPRPSSSTICRPLVKDKEPRWRANDSRMQWDRLK